jgi:uncharacterized repeat protein (TIGR01451 family)
MTVIGVVDPALSDGAVLTNTATIFAETITPDPDESNNQAQHGAPVAAIAQIGIDKYDLTDPVAPDGLLVYALVVTNSGPSLARAVVITDTLPPHVTYHSTTGVCAEGPAGVLTCAVGDLAAGARTTFLVVVRVDAAAQNGLVLRNVATLTSTTPLTNSTLVADETTRVLVSGGPQADLEVVKRAEAPSAPGGGLVTFTLAITNHGPSPVRSVQLLDLLPDGLTLVRVHTSQGFCNGGVSCLLGALDFGVDANGAPLIVGTAVVTLVARVDSELADGAVITNTAYVQSELADPQPENNLDDASVSVSAQSADLYIGKQAALYATAGDYLTYTLTVGNRGPAAAENATVRDPMPVGVRYVSATPAPTGGAVAEPLWNLGLLPAGASTTIQVMVQVDPQAPPGLIIMNTAQVTSTTPDLNPANNQATATTQSYGAADLELVKQADRGVVFGGETITYTITITNHGPSLSDRVDVKELIPPGTELTTLGASQGVCVSAICQVGNIAVGQPVVITATVHVISPTMPPGTVLTNTAALFTNTPDPTPEDNQDSAGVQIGPVVELSALKMTVAQTATVGTVISFTLIVTNHGPSAAPSIIITDHLPYRFTYLSSTAVNGCRMLDEVTMVCDAGPLAANAAVRVDAYFFISSIAPGTVSNRIVANAPGAALVSGTPESSLDLPTNPIPTALLLESYTLSKTEDALILMWKTISEFRTAGFRIWRGESPERSQAILLTPEDIPGHGVGSSYVYADTAVRTGVIYWYWLQEVTTDGGGWEHLVLSGWLGSDAPAKLYLPLVTNELAAAAAPASAPAATDAAALTATPQPTATSVDTATPTPTPIPTDTATPTATSTPTPTFTPSLAASPTDAPPPAVDTPTALPETPTPANPPPVAPEPGSAPPAVAESESPAPTPVETPAPAETPAAGS